MKKQWDDASLVPAPIQTTSLERYAPSTRSWQGIPSIAWVGGKTLWASWHSGGDSEEGLAMYVLLGRSDDNGLTWREPLAVVDPPDNVTAGDAPLWRSPEGHLWWFWTQRWIREKGRCWDGRAGVFCSVCRDPLAESPSWTKPRRISDGIVNAKPSTTGDGRWLLPVSIRAIEPHHPAVEGRRLAGLVVSDDHGKTFSWVGGADLPDRTCDEHHIIERKDNSLLLLARSKCGMTQSISVDGGITWSKGEKNGLPCPNSRFWVKRLDSGRLLMVNHPSSDTGPPHGGREKITASLSDDEGVTWHSHTLIDVQDPHPHGTTYPEADQADDGTIYIMYDLHRYRYGGILLVHFTEEELLEKKITSGVLRVSGKWIPNVA